MTYMGIEQVTTPAGFALTADIQLAGEPCERTPSGWQVTVSSVVGTTFAVMLSASGLHDIGTHFYESSRTVKATSRPPQMRAEQIRRATQVSNLTRAIPLEDGKLQDPDYGF
jgi:hypothetical protein